MNKLENEKMKENWMKNERKIEWKLNLKEKLNEKWKKNWIKIERKIEHKIGLKI